MLTFLYVLHFLVCFILIGVVLLQRGKGQDLGASLGGGGANTIFGSRGAGNFLTKMTTGSAIIFMITSLSLSYLGYKTSDARLFEESEPFVPEGAAPKADAGLEEIPAAAGAPDAGEEAGGLVEIPSPEAGATAGDAASDSAAAADATAGSGGADSTGAALAPAPGAEASSPAGGAAPAASEAAPAAESAPAGDAATGGTPAAEPAAAAASAPKDAAGQP